MSDENNSKRQYKQKYDYNSRKPLYADIDSLTEQQVARLTTSKTFCMLPWVHQHAYPDGRVYPCCFAEYWHPVGNLKTHTMKEVWNQDGYKEIRKLMLQDKPVKQCVKCYEQEENGFFSLRLSANKHFGHYIKGTDKTNSDGSLNDILKTSGGASFNQKVGFIEMSGKEVFRHAVEKMSSSIIKALEDANLTASDINLLIPHQANIRILEGVSKKLNLTPQQVIITVDKHANTSAASIPLALDYAIVNNKIKENDIIVFEALGGGLTWGSAIARF